MLENSMNYIKVSLTPDESTGTNAIDSVTIEYNNGPRFDKQRGSQLEEKLEQSEVISLSFDLKEINTTSDCFDYQKISQGKDQCILDLVIKRQFKQAQQKLLIDIANLDEKEATLVYWFCQFVKDQTAKEIIRIIQESKKIIEDVFQSDEKRTFLVFTDQVRFLRGETLFSIFRMSSQHPYLPLQVLTQDNIINGFQIMLNTE